MFNNPLILRYRYSLLRPQQLWVILLVYILIVSSLLFVTITLYRTQEAFVNYETFCKIHYYIFLSFQVLILWVWTSANSASAIRDEVSNKSYDFFKMLPLTASQKMHGILIGKNLMALLVAVINLLFLLFFGLQAKLNSALQFQYLLVLLSVTILVNSLALLASIVNPAKKHKKPGIILAIIIGFYLLAIAVQGVIALFKADSPEKFTVKFFHFDIPILILITLVSLYFSCWAVKGILRKFTKERQPLFSRAAAFLFLLGYEFITLGLFYSYLTEDTEIVYLFWLASFVPLVLVPLGYLRNFDDYLEFAGLIKEKSPPDKIRLLTMMLHSNLSLGLGLFIVWSLFPLATLITGLLDWFPDIYSILVIFSFFTFYIFLLEIHAVFSPAYSKIKLLLITVIILYMLLPPIYSAIVESDIIYRFSPLGYFFHIFDRDTYQPGIDLVVLAVNFSLTIIAAIPVCKRYAFALAARKKM
jgi:hypothetical protein